MGQAPYPTLEPLGHRVYPALSMLANTPVEELTVLQGSPAAVCPVGLSKCALLLANSRPRLP